MASVYEIESSRSALKSGDENPLATRLPYIPFLDNLSDTLAVEIDFFRTQTDAEAGRSLLNKEIEGGMSWPFEFALNEEAFQAYFLSHAAFVVREVRSSEVIGAFYCKPNFPGRCSHYCNGGFITRSDFRRRGVGNLMGRFFIRVARDLSYHSALFNLVFTSNTVSTRLWEKLGFQPLARLPQVGRLQDGYTDAVQYYLKLTEESETRNTADKALVGARIWNALIPACPSLIVFALSLVAAGMKSHK